MSEEKTPGRVLHESLCESAVAEFDIPIENFESWDRMRESQRKRLEDAAQAVLDNRTPWGDVDAVTVEQNPWYAVVRSGGADGRVVQVIGYGDTRLTYHDSVAEREAAST